MTIPMRDPFTPPGEHLGKFLLDLIEAPGEAAIGAIASGIRGQNILKGAARGVTHGAIGRDIQLAGEQRGLWGTKTPIIGPEGSLSWLGNVALTLGVDPLLLASPATKGFQLTKAGRIAAELRPAITKLQKAGHIPSLMTAGTFLQKTEKTQFLKSLAGADKGTKRAAKLFRQAEALRDKYARTAKRGKILERIKELEDAGKDFQAGKLRSKMKRIRPDLAQIPNKRFDTIRTQIQTGQRRFMGLTGPAGANLYSQIAGRSLQGLEALEGIKGVGTVVKTGERAIGVIRNPVERTVTNIVRQFQRRARMEADDAFQVGKTLARYVRKHLPKREQQEEVARILNLQFPLATKIDRRNIILGANKTLSQTYVRDEKGLPKIMYHGTSQGFSELDVAYTSEQGLFGAGLYFTDNPKIASEYTKAHSKGKSFGEPLGWTQTRIFKTKDEAEDFLKNNPQVAGHIQESPSRYGNEFLVTYRQKYEPNVRSVYLNIRRPFQHDKLGSDVLSDKKDIQDIYEAIKSDNPKLAQLFIDSVDSVASQNQNRITNRQVWKILKDNIDEGPEGARQILEQAGFDGIVHGGGFVSGGPRHSVAIAFSNDQIVNPPSVFKEKTTYHSGQMVEILPETTMEAEKVFKWIETGENADMLVNIKTMSKVGPKAEKRVSLQVPLSSIDRTSNVVDFTNPAFHDFLDIVRAGFETEGRAEKALGILRKMRYGYFPYAVHPRVLKLIDGKWRQMMSKNPYAKQLYSRYLGSANKRSLEEFTIDELNEAFRLHGGKEVFDQLFKEESFIRHIMRVDPDGFGELAKTGIFNVNPALGYYMRTLSGIKARRNTEIINTVIEKMSLPIRHLRENKKGELVQEWRNYVLLSDRKMINELLDKYPDYAIYVPSNKYLQIYPEDRLTAEAKKLLRKAGIVEITADDLEKFPAVSRRIKAHLIPREAFDEITRQFRALTDPKEVGEFVRMFDQGMSWWKAWTLLGVFAYHSRNFVSDQWLMFLGGLRNPTLMVRAGQILMTAATEDGKYNRALSLATKPFGKTGQIGKTLRDLPPITDRFGNVIADAETFYHQLRQHGVLGGGWQADVLEGLERESALWRGVNLKNPASIMAQMLSRRSPYLRVMGSMNEFMTNIPRVALYLDRLEKGDDWVQAAAHVRKFLFDYNEISELDRKIRRAMPFWMWTKHNVPLAIETAIKQPEKYLAVLRAKNALERGIGPEADQARADWIKKLYGVALRRNPKTGEIEYFMARSWWPGSDLAELTTPLETAFSMANPWLRSPIETVFNQRAFFQSPISRYEGQEGRIGLPAGGEVTIPSFLGMDGRKWEHLIRDYLPLRAYTEYVEKMGANIPGIPREEIQATRGGILRRAVTANLALKTTKVDAQTVLRQRMQELERLRRSAKAVYNSRMRRNDVRGAERTLKNYEKRARKIQQQIQGYPLD